MLSYFYFIFNQADYCFFSCYPAKSTFAKKTLPVTRNIIIDKQIIKLLRKNKVNIVHTNDLRIHFMWSISSKIYGCKCVWHQRSLFPDWFLYKLISRLPNKIVSISEYVYSSLPKFNKRKSDIIYKHFLYFLNSTVV